MKALAIVLVLAAMVGCKPASEPPKHLDGATADPADCPKACAKLSSLGCPEGQRSDCAAMCARIVEAGTSSADPGCVARAVDTSSLHACGVRCLP